MRPDICLRSSGSAAALRSQLVTNSLPHSLPIAHLSNHSLCLQRFTYRGPNLSVLLGATRSPRLAVISVPGLPENRPGLVTGEQQQQHIIKMFYTHNTIA
jgi:hypothetical protein